MKYFDDLSLLEAINLKDLEKDWRAQEFPLEYHRRTGHFLPPGKSKIQAKIQEILDYSQVNEMGINPNKSKVILFNMARKFDFMPEIYLDQDTPMSVVESQKLLSITISANLGWNEHVSDLCKRGFV